MDKDMTVRTIVFAILFLTVLSFLVGALVGTISGERNAAKRIATGRSIIVTNESHSITYTIKDIK